MQPYTLDDRKQFMDKLIRKKGDLFRNEQYKIIQAKKGLTKGRDKVLLQIEIDVDDYHYEWHTLGYLFTEFEFLDGVVFGIA